MNVVRATGGRPLGLGLLAVAFSRDTGMYGRFGEGGRVMNRIKAIVLGSIDRLKDTH